MQKLERDALKARIAMLEEQVRCAQIGLAKAHLVVGGVPPLPHVTVTHCNCGAADRTAHRADCMARWPGGFVQDNRPDPLLGDMDVFGVRNLTAETEVKSRKCDCGATTSVHAFPVHHPDCASKTNAEQGE